MCDPPKKKLVHRLLSFILPSTHASSLARHSSLSLSLSSSHPHREPASLRRLLLAHQQIHATTRPASPPLCRPAAATQLLFLAPAHAPRREQSGCTSVCALLPSYWSRRGEHGSKRRAQKERDIYIYAEGIKGMERTEERRGDEYLVRPLIVLLHFKTIIDARLHH